MQEASSRKDCSAYGAVAEHLAVVELLRRGHRVAIPVVDDDGVDLVVNYSLRVQVKNATRLPIEPKPGFVYEKFAWRSKRSWSEADIFMLHGVDTGVSRWWIVPAEHLIGAGASLALYVGGTRRMTSLQTAVRSCEDAWGLFSG